MHHAQVQVLRGFPGFAPLLRVSFANGALVAPSVFGAMMAFCKPQALDFHSIDDKRSIKAAIDDEDVPQKYRERAEILWRLHKGQSINQVARELDRSKSTVVRWRDRYLADGKSGLFKDYKPARVGGRPSKITEDNLDLLEREDVLDFDNPAGCAQELLGVSKRTAWRLIRKLRERLRKSQKLDVPLWCIKCHEVTGIPLDLLACINDGDPPDVVLNQAQLQLFHAGQNDRVPHP